MYFAHFAHVWGKPGMTPHERYDQLWRELELCDDLGFDYSFCVEHHFRPDESWMSSPSLYTVAAGMKTKNMRIGPMGYVVPLYNPLRLAEEIAIADQMLGGRMELGLVPGINAIYFEPFGLKYEDRKLPTLEYVDYLKAAFGDQPFSFDGKIHQTKSATLAVEPVQKPHPPMWMMSRDRETLEFCAEKGINPGYFLVFPREEAAPRYRKFLTDWKAKGWSEKPKIGYSTVVFVDETDEKARANGLERAAQAYRGFIRPTETEEEFQQALAEFCSKFDDRGEHGAAELFRNIFDPDYLLEKELMFVGSPATVGDQLKRLSTDGVFDTFMGEFNFSDLPEDDLLRSIRLFGEEIIPVLRNHQPF